ncbi:hypothetical protein RvY_07978 [Ramazzottius varieornatus]|uniref:Uncharacterized protein n=1 Tax=Ramazzottius varieornatus TaxID=947166 RepID=A0A1D1VDG7_RAMVA|nr:hypothetical protein RvY_07978 [Ramazzottius varieornatus]
MILHDGAFPVLPDLREVRSCCLSVRCSRCPVCSHVLSAFEASTEGTEKVSSTELATRTIHIVSLSTVFTEMRRKYYIRQKLCVLSCPLIASFKF